MWCRGKTVVRGSLRTICARLLALVQYSLHESQNNGENWKKCFFHAMFGAIHTTKHSFSYHERNSQVCVHCPPVPYQSSNAPGSTAGGKGGIVAATSSSMSTSPEKKTSAASCKRQRTAFAGFGCRMNWGHGDQAVLPGK